MTARQQHPQRERRYLVTQEELNQIKNDCAYPESESCEGCPLADGEDESWASGLGCNFKGANVLMEEILTRTHSSSPAAGPQVPERIGSIRQPILQEDAYLIERVNAGMGEWEYVIQFCGEYFATAPSERIARRIVEREMWCSPEEVRQQAAAKERERVLETLEDLRKYANGEYKEADLSDNEREMRIHLEYENRIWGIMQSLRQQSPEQQEAVRDD